MAMRSKGQPGRPSRPRWPSSPPPRQRPSREAVEAPLDGPRARSGQRQRSDASLFPERRVGPHPHQRRSEHACLQRSEHAHRGGEEERRRGTVVMTRAKLTRPIEEWEGRERRGEERRTRRTRRGEEDEINDEEDRQNPPTSLSVEHVGLQAANTELEI